MHLLRRVVNATYFLFLNWKAQMAQKYSVIQEKIISMQKGNASSQSSKLNPASPFE